MKNLGFSSMFVATVVQFLGSNDDPATVDTNGKMPVLLNVVAGQCPNARVLSGTVAERNGFEVGKCYLTSVSETEPRDYKDEESDDIITTRNFNYSAVAPATFSEILQAKKELGAPVLIDVTSDREVNGKKVALSSGKKEKVTPIEA